MHFPIPTSAQIQEAIRLPTEPTYVSSGGFKAVYLVRNLAGKDEALKAIYIPDASTEEDSVWRDQLVARAEREIKALGECNLPNLVRLGTIPAQPHRIDGHDYLVYSEEFLPGEPLAKWIGRQPLPTFERLHDLFSVLIGLIRDLTQIGYLHRDIKPDNIMDTGLPDRRYVMLDLGIAYKMHGTQLTQGGNPPGTTRYMAPELLRPDYKDNMDFRCDLYAAGLTIYVLASGTHPFAPRPEHAYATVYRIMNMTPQPLAAYCHLLSPLLGISGAEAGASGWFSGLRQFSMNKYAREVGGGRYPLVRYVSTPLLSHIKQTDLDAFSAVVPEIATGSVQDAAYDGQEPSRTEEALQSWAALGVLCQKYCTGDTTGDITRFKGHISRAVELWSEIQEAGFTQDVEPNLERLEAIKAGINLFEQWAELVEKR